MFGHIHLSGKWLFLSISVHSIEVTGVFDGTEGQKCSRRLHTHFAEKLRRRQTKFQRAGK
jgi:hypothetical protein